MPKEYCQADQRSLKFPKKLNLSSRSKGISQPSTKTKFFNKNLESPSPTTTTKYILAHIYWTSTILRRST